MRAAGALAVEQDEAVPHRRTELLALRPRRRNQRLGSVERLPVDVADRVVLVAPRIHELRVAGAVQTHVEPRELRRGRGHPGGLSSVERSRRRITLSSPVAGPANTTLSPRASMSNASTRRPRRRASARRRPAPALLATPAEDQQEHDREADERGDDAGGDQPRREAAPPPPPPSTSTRPLACTLASRPSDPLPPTVTHSSKSLSTSCVHVHSSVAPAASVSGPARVAPAHVVGRDLRQRRASRVAHSAAAT